VRPIILSVFDISITFHEFTNVKHPDKIMLSLTYAAAIVIVLAARQEGPRHDGLARKGSPGCWG
jgi:hypothetical protein